MIPDTVVTIPQLSSVAGDTATSTVVPPPDLEVHQSAMLHLLIPIPGLVWSDLRDSFHEKRGTDRIHNALDIMAPRGTPVLSVDGGTLLKLHNSVPGGLMAYASDPTRHYIYLYGHLDRYNPALREGQALARGDTIGFVGSTGNAAAAGPHLHFAVVENSDMTKWWIGTPIDPRPLMK